MKKKFPMFALICFLLGIGCSGIARNEVNSNSINRIAKHVRILNHSGNSETGRITAGDIGEAKDIQKAYGEYVAELLNKAGGFSAADIENRLFGLFTKAGIAALPEPKGAVRAGKVLAVKAWLFGGEKDLLVTSMALGLGCDSTALISILKKEGLKWRVVYSVPAIEGTEIEKGREMVRVLVAHKESGGDKIYLASVSPGCSSNWRRLKLETYEISQENASPSRGKSFETTIYIGMDEPVYQLQNKSGRVALSFTGEGTEGNGYSPEKHEGWLEVDNEGSLKLSPF